MNILLIIAVIFAICYSFRNKGGKNSDNKPFVKNITECNDMKDIVSSIGYGRVFPYYTGMTVEEVRKIVEKQAGKNHDFESEMALSQMTGFMMGVSLPGPQSDYISDIKAHFNKNRKMYSTSIYLNGEEAKKDAYALLHMKFGNPTLSDKQFVIWRNRYMVININKEDDSINIINEALFLL